MSSMQKIFSLIIILSLILPKNSFAQEEFLDLDIEFGQYTLSLKYLFEGSKAPIEGYLLSVPDLAMLKLDIDSFKEDCEQIVHEASLVCIKDLEACQRDSNLRVSNLISENLSLKDSLILSEKNLENQKLKTWIYSAVGVLAGSVIATIIYVVKQ